MTLVGLGHADSPPGGRSLYADPAGLTGALRRQLLRQSWFPWLPVCLGVGIAVYFVLDVEPGPWPALTGMTVSIAMLALGLRKPALRAPGLALLCLASGFAVAQWRTFSVAAPVLLREIGPVMLSGEVLASEARPVGFRLTLRPEHGLGREQVRLERVRITVRGGDRPRAGDRVRVLAKLMPPSPPLRPGAFDFARMAWFMRLGAVGYAVGRLEVEENAAGQGLLGGVERLRETVSARILDTVPGTSGAVTAALLTGDRGAIPEPTLHAMRDAGLAHLLAISGLHVGLVAGCLFFAVRLGLSAIPAIALRYPVKKIAAIVSLLGALAYLLLTGMTVPTQRAVIMVGFAVIAVLLNRTPISMRVLACAAMLVLVMAPESLLSPSFQMSFAAVAALIATYETASPRLADWRRDGGIGRRILLYFLAVALTTVVAGLATAPFAAFHFHRLASLGLVANLVAVPLMAVAIMPLGLLALLLMPLGLEALALVPMGLAIEAMLTVAHTISAWPGAAQMIADVPVWVMSALALCGLWLCLWRGSLRLAAVPVAAAVIVSSALLTRSDAIEIVVSDDGARYAVRDGEGRIAMRPRRTDDWTGETWLRAWGIDPQNGTNGLSPLLSCDSVGCVYRADAARPVSFPNGLEALTEDCRHSAIVIARVPTRWLCRQPDLVIDRFSLWRHGAHRLRLAGGSIDVSTVAQQQGSRPWSRSWQRMTYRGHVFSTYRVNKSDTAQSDGPES